MSREITHDLLMVFRGMLDQPGRVIRTLALLTPLLFAFILNRLHHEHTAVNKACLQPKNPDEKPLIRLHGDEGFELVNVEVRNRRVPCFKRHRDKGTPSKAPVFFLHGFPDNFHSWKHQMNALATQGHSSYAPALRGYSPGDKADGQDFSILNLALDVLATVEALQLREFHLVGHDWGSVIAGTAARLFLQGDVKKTTTLHTLTLMSVPDIAKTSLLELAVRQPIQFVKSWYAIFFQMGLGLPEWWLRSGGGIEKLWDHWGLCVDKGRLEAVKKTLKEDNNIRAAMAYYRMYLPTLFPGTSLRLVAGDWISWCHGLAPPRETEDVAVAKMGIGSLEELSQWPLTLPTLIVVGEHDGCMDPALFVPGEVHHKVVKVAEAGHFLQHEQPETITRLIASHIAAAQGSP